jgi:hypothetical protein
LENPDLINQTTQMQYNNKMNLGDLRIYRAKPGSGDESHFPTYQQHSFKISPNQLVKA